MADTVTTLAGRTFTVGELVRDPLGHTGTIVAIDLSAALIGILVSWTAGGTSWSYPDNLRNAGE